MKVIILFLWCFLFPSFVYANPITQDCTYNGIPLYGTVKVVKNGFADFKVKVVNSFANLNVKKVHSFANSCGEWKIIEQDSADFTIQFVNAFEDFSIKFVDSFAGLN